MKGFEYFRACSSAHLLSKVEKVGDSVFLNVALNIPKEVALLEQSTAQRKL